MKMVALVAAATLAIPVTKELFRLAFSKADNEKAQKIADMQEPTQQVNSRYTVFYNAGNGRQHALKPKTLDTTADIKHISDIPTNKG